MFLIVDPSGKHFLMKKYKFKTKKSLLKRIKITGKSKWMRNSANTSHLSASKTRLQKQRLKKSHIVKHADYKRLKKLI